MCWDGVVESIGRWWRERVRGTERRRDLSDALLTFAVGAALVTVGVVNTGGPSAGIEPGSRWLYLLPLGTICLTMLAKRRRPIIALGIGALTFAADLAMGGSIGVLLGFFDLTYAAALYASASWVRRLEIAVGVLVPAAAVAVFVTMGDLQAAVLMGLVLFALLGTPLWWGRAVRQQVEIAELAAARSRDLERLAELRQADAIREERTQMARDLHDALAGQLSTIAIQAESILATPQADAERHRNGLAAIRLASVAALREMRAMIGLLRTGEEQVASPARMDELEGLLDTFRAQGMVIEAMLPSALPSLPAAVDQAVYRIVQEALTNEFRHGVAGRAAVGIEIDEGTMEVTVIGPASEATVPGGGDGIGLLTMRERAEASGGIFSAGWRDTADGRRWRVRAVFDLEEPR